MPSKLRVIDKTHKKVLVALYEIAKMAGVKRQQAAHIVRYWWFPEPVDCLACGKVWDYADVAAALQEHGYPKEEERPLKNVKVPEAA